MAQRKKRKYKLRNPTPLHRRRWFWTSIGVLMLAGALIYTLVFPSFVQIRDIRVQGTDTLADEDVRAAAEQLLDGQRFLTFPTKSVVWVNTNGIARAVEERFPRVRTASVWRVLPRSIAVRVTERKPTAVFCNGSCVLVDQYGVAFSKARDVSKDGATVHAVDIPALERGAPPLIRITSELHTKTPTLGEHVVDKQTMTKITDLYTRVQEMKDRSLQSIALVDKKRVNATFTNGWQAYFSLEGDIRNQLANLRLVLTKEIKERSPQLDYVDLRFGKRVYYAFSGQDREQRGTAGITAAGGGGSATGTDNTQQ